jgi:hypothetical protein
MNPETLLDYIRRRPFQPFRLHLTDGTTYEVRHPELVIVTRREAHVGVQQNGAHLPLADRVHIVSLLHITHLEPLEATDVSSN